MDYNDIGYSIGELVSEKQRAYSNAFKKTTDILKILYPNGVKFEDIDNVLFIARICDKLCRISQSGGRDPMNENPYQDIVGYGLLALKQMEKDDES